MKKNPSLLGPLLSLLLLAGCTTEFLYSHTVHPTGIIYTHTVHPLDVNHDRTQVVQKGEQGDIKHFQYYVNVTWGSNAIGDIANENGIETIYYADLERLSILGGIWQKFTVHVYGK